jgi:hypothetical protein
VQVSLVTRYVFQLAIQIFSIKMTGVGAVQSGMSGQDDTSAGAHNAVTQLTMVFAIPKREGDGQFVSTPQLTVDDFPERRPGSHTTL